jgi:hypothetical protein
MLGTGAVCDVGVLSSRQAFQGVRGLDGNLFIPSTTYSWLVRDRLIQVRRHIVKYTFVNQLIRDGLLFAVYLPEILDELARRLLFLGEKEIPLTDLRAILLAAHLGFPVVCADDGISKEIAGELDGKLILKECLNSESYPLRRAARDYRSVRAGRMTGEMSEAEGGGMTLSFFHVDLSPVIDEYVDERVLSPESILRLDDCSLVSVLQLPGRVESS